MSEHITDSIGSLHVDSKPAAPHKMPTQFQKDSILSKLHKLEEEDLHVLNNLDISQLVSQQDMSSLTEKL